MPMKRVKVALPESFMVALSMPQLKLSASPAERRVHPRRSISLTIRGKRIEQGFAALRHAPLSMSLRDLSAGGMSAISPAPLAPGERLSLSIPVMGPRIPGSPGEWDAVGRVIRCEPSSLGYRIAVEFDTDPLRAA